MPPEGEEMADREEEMESLREGGDPQWPNAVTLVLAGANSRQRRWAVDTAIEVTRKLAASQAKVIIADLQREQPSALINALGIAPGAGIVDVLFRGASFSTVARRPEDESFFVLPLGDEPPPGAVLLQHGRWRKIAARLPDAEAHLLPCVSAEDWLEAGPIPGFEACIVLNGLGVELELPSGAHQLAEFLAPPEVREDATPIVHAPPAGFEPTGTGHDRAPAGEGESEAEGGGAGPTSEASGSGEKEWLATGAPGDEAEAEVEVASEAELEDTADPEVQLAEPVGGGSVDDWDAEGVSAGFSARRGPDRRGLLIGAAVVIAAVAGVAAWQLLGSGDAEPGRQPLEAAGASGDTLAVQSPGESARGVENEPAPEDQTPPPSVEAAAGEEAAAPSAELAVALPYSVAIASYSSFEDALQRQRRWSRGDVRFYVAPTVVRGVVYYRVFAGLLADRQEAEELMEELVRAGVKDTVRNWDVRPTRLAFSFGTYGSEREARSSAETLRGRGIPAYVVEVPGSGGEDVSYRVYAGGYERPEDARPLRERIADAGLDVELVERVGMVPR